MYFLEKKRK